MPTIVVPATSANLGAGFDSLGLAVDLFLRVTIGAPTATWQIHHQLGANVPSDATNLIITSALTVAPDLPPHELTVTSEIPLARGLGSSASAIVAGILMADYLGQLNLTAEQKLAAASAIEGHPDNVAPALAGNLTVCGTLTAEQFTVIPATFPHLDLLAYVPDYQLSTKKSRAVLPATLPFKAATAASSTANVLVAALLTNNHTQLKRILAADQWHEPYRATLVPELAQLRKLGATVPDYLGSYLSGAGPTVMNIISRTKQSQLIAAAKSAGLTGKFIPLTVNHTGATIID